MNRQQLVKRLDAAWAAFTDSYAGLSKADLVEPGVTKAWSVRDIVAHVTTWEEEALKYLGSILEGRRPPRYSVMYGGIDAFNALRTAQKKDLPLDEVFRQQKAVHHRVMAIVEQVPEDQLVTETRFRRRLRFDTYSHYLKHAAAIQRWRDARSAPKTP
jgi:hypothetical protein